MTAVALIFAAFVIGFLLGDRSGVKQANTILDENMRVLLMSIREEAGIAPDEDKPLQPTIH